jgi:predicted transcriptional regulator
VEQKEKGLSKMDKISTSLFRAHMAEAARDTRTRSLEDAIQRQIDGTDEFSRSKFRKMQRAHDRSIEKGMKTSKMVDGKLVKKIKGLGKSVRRAMSSMAVPSIGKTIRRVASIA